MVRGSHEDNLWDLFIILMRSIIMKIKLIKNKLYRSHVSMHLLMYNNITL